MSVFFIKLLLDWIELDWCCDMQTGN